MFLNIPLEKMSFRRQDIITCNSTNLQKYVKCLITIDPKIIVKGGVKIGDTITGNVFLTNRKIVSCKGFYIRLLYSSTHSFNVTTVSYLITNGKTQDGIPMNIKSIPTGTHRLPFSLKLPSDYCMVPIYETKTYPQHYHLQVIIVFPSSSLPLHSMPITVTEYLNIRQVPEYNLPIQHCIKGNMSILGTDMLTIFITSPRSAYISGEELPFELEITEGHRKIKKITVSFVRRDYMDITQIEPVNSKKYVEECILSKTISKISAFMQENLELPLGLKQVYSICKKYEQLNGFYSLEARTYFLKFAIESTGMGKTVHGTIPIVIGTVDTSPDSNDQNLSPSGSSSSNEDTNSMTNIFGSFTSLLLPTYSEIMGSNSPSLRHGDSTTSLETLPPTFEEALQKGRHSVPLLHF